MSSQRYERVLAHDEDDSRMERVSEPQQSAPLSSPPPSFRSRASSTNPHRHSSEHEPLVDRNLAETFDAPSDDDSDDGHEHRLDDRQRVMSGRPVESEAVNSDATTPAGGRPAPVERRVTQLPVFAPATAGHRPYGGNAADGVFANLSAKPERGEELDEKPPTYEQAAADAAPPYWETTILTPSGAGTDDVFIDGLPVGSLFSFLWNGIISMSFQLVGFLLTYLLHTTHAAKNGSKAGLGITLVNYGFSMRGAARRNAAQPAGDNAGDAFVPPPDDPNSHDFDPSAVSAVGDAAGGDVGGGGGLGSMTPTDWFAYALMIVGWFVLIRAISEYLKARRHEQLVLQSPARGLSVPVVAEGEAPESVA